MIAALLIVLVATTTELLRTRQRLRIAFHDPVYGILTRAGGEDAWHRLRRRDIALIFLDIDDLHAMNAQLGYAKVDRRIATALKETARDCLIAMRWYSGDELVFVVLTEKSEQIAECIQANLHEQELSGTFAITPIANLTLCRAVERAVAVVQAQKLLTVVIEL